MPERLPDCKADLYALYPAGLSIIIPAVAREQKVGVTPSMSVCLFAGFLSGWDVPLLVFVAETSVVTLSTLRTVAISRGWRRIAPLLGCAECTIWLFAIAQVMRNLDSPACFVAFAGGFTLGNYLGIWIESKVALGTVVVRIITNKDGRKLAEDLRAARFGVTCVDGQGASGPVQVIFTVINRCQLSEVVALIRAFDPGIFYSVDELQYASAGIFPKTASLAARLMPLGNPFRRRSSAPPANIRPS